MQIICFHKPKEENGYLSNWHRSPFTIGGMRYSSMEQYMMQQKAVCFHDAAVAAQIMGTDDPALIKEFGRQVSGYDANIWNGVRQIIVYEGLLAKFSQDEELKARLAGTGDAVLAECAVHDRIWGIGLSMQDADRLDIGRWKGQNLLGYALMMARAKLQRA